MPVPAEGLDLTCPACGPVRIAAATAELHRNRHDGFRLVQAPCPRCGDLIATAAPSALAQATAAGVRCWELLPPAPPLTDADAARLRAALDAGWPWHDDPPPPCTTDPEERRPR